MKDTKTVTLRKLEPIDVDGMLEWMHDETINCFFRFPAKAYTQEDALEFITQASKMMENGSEYHYAITADDNEYLGTISLKKIDKSNRNAEYAICLRRKAMGTGIAQAATQELLKIAFLKLELNGVYLNVFSDNLRAIKLYEKCGFKYEGEWRQCCYTDKGIRNLKWYRILKEEWRELT